VHISSSMQELPVKKTAMRKSKDTALRMFPEVFRDIRVPMIREMNRNSATGSLELESLAPEEMRKPFTTLECESPNSC
jgi:hypothetical protein